MHKWIFHLVFFFSVGLAFGHQPDISSTMLVEGDNDDWLVQVRSSLTAFEIEIEAAYGPDSYTSPDEFKQLVLQHLKDKLSIRFNEGKALLLADGLVNLGHETSIVFKLQGEVDTIREIDVKNAGFEHIKNSQSALLILKKGMEKKQFVLDRNNDYQLHLWLTANGIEQSPSTITNKPSNARYWLLLGLIVLIMGIAGYYLIGYKKNQRA